MLSKDELVVLCYAVHESKYELMEVFSGRGMKNKAIKYLNNLEEKLNEMSKGTGSLVDCLTRLMEGEKP